MTTPIDGPRLDRPKTPTSSSHASVLARPEQEQHRVWELPGDQPQRVILAAGVTPVDLSGITIAKRNRPAGPITLSWSASGAWHSSSVLSSGGQIAGNFENHRRLVHLVVGSGSVFVSTPVPARYPVQLNET
jgi:hypothetical protein